MATKYNFTFSKNIKKSTNNSEDGLFSSSTPSEKILSVSDLTLRISDCLQNSFSYFYLKGEVSSLKQASSGHIYFLLKDENAVIRCVLFKSLARKLDIVINDGLEIIVGGKLEVYAQQGSYNVVTSHIFQANKGILEIKFEQLREKLNTAGFFDAEHKKELPQFFQKVGLVVAESSEAMKDIIKVSYERFPKIEFYIQPSLVTGKKAAWHLAKALQTLDKLAPKLGLDVIILARGGGSKEDLWAFNEEILIKAIYGCKTPIINAVGHQTDVTLADLVADHSVATPTAAGMLISTCRLEDLESNLIASADFLNKYTARYAQETKISLINHLRMIDAYINKIKEHLNFKLEIANKNLQLDVLNHRKLASSDNLKSLATTLHSLLIYKLEQHKRNLYFCSDILNSHNPKQILAKGYTIVFRGEEVIADIPPNDLEKLVIQWRNGAKQIETLKTIKSKLPK